MVKKALVLGGGGAKALIRWEYGRHCASMKLNLIS